MPGGVYNWNQGEVLDAADLNEFLGNQVIARFTNTAARTAAYGVASGPGLSRAFVADQGAGVLSVVDIATGAVTQQLN